MHSKYDFGETDKQIVYVRAVDVADLPKEMRDHAHGASAIYAVHAPDGERLALVRDRRLAFILARQNDFSPVSVH
jgi:hypothetical protein